MSTFLKKFFGTVSIQLLARFVTLISGVIYARYLGPNEYGLYGYVMSILVLITLPVTAGLPDLIIREVANYQLEKKWSYLSGIINWSRSYVIIISLIIITITGVVIHFNVLDESTISLLSIAILVIPFRGLLVQQGAILNGFRKPVLAQIPTQVLAPIITLGILLFYILNGNNLTGGVLFEIYIIASVAAFILSAYYLNRIIKNETKVEKPKYLLRNWHVSLAPFTIMALISTFNTELASVFLGWLDSPESVAYFKVAMQGMSLIVLGLSSINTIIMPQVARLYKQGDLNQTQILLTKSVRLSAIVSLPIFFILTIFGDIIITLLFGDEYLPAYSLLVILCIGQAVNVLMGSVGTVLNMTNNEKYSLRSILITLMISIVLLYLLVPSYSATGAAISVSTGLIIWNVLMAVDVYRRTGLKTWIQF